MFIVALSGATVKKGRAMKTKSYRNPYSVLCLIDEAFERDDFLEVCRLANAIDDDDAYAAVLKSYPNLRYYDAKGNYDGSVSNENGWTP
jgi:hypothetical protein